MRSKPGSNAPAWKGVLAPETDGVPRSIKINDSIGQLAEDARNAAFADEHELQIRQRQEGVFFGAVSFAAKAATGPSWLMDSW